MISDHRNGKSSPAEDEEPDRLLLGIDIGGTKTSAGLLLYPCGEIVANCQLPTRPQRGRDAVLRDVIELAAAVTAKVDAAFDRPISVGIGIAELVDQQGRIASAALLDWRGQDAVRAISDALQKSVHFDADVRCAARAEAVWGAGKDLDCFLYITVGTGISAALVFHGEPLTGHRGLTGTFASSPLLVPDPSGNLVTTIPLERFSAGPAIAARFASNGEPFHGTAADVLALAQTGHETAQGVVTTAGLALGSAIAQLINVFDPEAVIVGGGLGLAQGLYSQSMQSGIQRHVWSDFHRDIPIHRAALGVHSGWMGAALCSLQAATSAEKDAIRQ